MPENGFRFAVNTNSFPKTMKPADSAKLIKKLGFEGVEWGLPKLEDAAAAAKEMTKAASGEGLESMAFLNAGHLWKTDLMRKWSEAVAPAGCKRLRVSPPWTAWDFHESLNQKASFPDLFKLTREGLEKLAPLSIEYGIQYTIETHAGNTACSAPLARQLADGLDPKAVGFILDPANTIIEGFLRPRQSIETLDPYISYLHVKNIDFTEMMKDRPDPAASVKRRRIMATSAKLHEGLLDWVEVIFGLNVVGWRGWLSFEEYFKTDLEGGLQEGLAFLRQAIEAAPKDVQKPYSTFNE